LTESIDLCFSKGCGAGIHGVMASHPPRSRSTELRVGPRTATEARWFLAEALDILEVEVDRDAANLLTSELVSNAAKHGKEPIDLTVSVEEGLQVSVRDRGAGFDPEGAQLARSEGGWGLRIVQDLASSWGVERGDEGTEVWFRL
jgi:anti-sigma regulatory factor (Ser/Thr protein kinase)